MFILEIFSVWVIKNGQFQFLVTFLAVFFWYVNCTNLVCISSYFEHRQCFIWGFLIFSFLVFTNFSWSGNISVLVCKLYFYFGHIQNFGQYLYLSVFSKQWKCPTFCFCLNIYFIAILLKTVFFLYFLEAKNPCFVMKSYSKSSYICVFILSKKTAQLILRKPSWFSNGWSHKAERPLVELHF